MSSEFTLEELARSVRDWCQEHRVIPANGQAAEEISERSIRYYRTLGLLDPPQGNYTKTFSKKHWLQLIGIRLLQAQGLPLRRIRDELYGKSLEDLAALEQRAGRFIKAAALTAPLKPSLIGESWAVMPLENEFLLISRQNRQLPRMILEKINRLLRSACPESETSERNTN